MTKTDFSPKLIPKIHTPPIHDLFSKAEDLTYVIFPVIVVIPSPRTTPFLLNPLSHLMQTILNYRYVQ